MTKPTLVSNDQTNTETENATTSIAKPESLSLDQFKSKRAAVIANVETLPSQLPHHSIAQARDFVRLHADEENFWSEELCFTYVPIIGANRDSLHLIVEDLALKFLQSAQIQHFRLALATKPHDKFFLCHIPTRNLDNSYNRTAVRACEQAKTAWVQATSRREEGVDEYRINFARDEDAFPSPKWPSQSLNTIIMTAFAGLVIAGPDHPGLLRLIGAKQS